MTGYDTLLPYFQRELAFLRREGVAFSRRYPQIARRLDIVGDAVTDPDVERLIEAVAFLTGRIQHTIDREFPIIPAALLNILYPQFADPIPSMAIAQFLPPQEAGKLTTGLTVPRGRQFFAGSGAQAVRFRTCYPATIWPIEPTFADFDDSFPDIVLAEKARSLFRLRLRCTGPGFGPLGADRLRLHLAGLTAMTDRLYQMLTSEVQAVYLLPDGDASRRVRLPADSIEPVGFRPEESVLPEQQHGLTGFRLLLELFQFPEKFRFLDVIGLMAAGTATMVDILFPVSVAPPPEIHAEASTFRLGCTPVINLFEQVSQPIRLTQEKLEYLVLPDIGDRAAVEVHSIRSVAAAPDPARQVPWVRPYFGFCGDETAAEQGIYWVARRRPTELAGIPGDEMFLTFIDPSFQPTEPAGQVLYARLACTNRRLAPYLPANQPLQPDEAAVPGAQMLITAPTAPVEPVTDGAVLWRLASQLALGDVSLLAGDAAALRQFLQLYALNVSRADEVLIDAVQGARATPAQMRRSDGATLLRGTDISLSLDDSSRPEGSLYLLMTVLDRALPVFAAANSFTRLSACLLSKPQVWKSWPARLGDRPIL
ncbi:type VI secretion system baseplate subunit TssF [Oceanibaculum pacificum]|uniref:Type VI secretion system protein ImpG n=1 Tax=Oceanibaculum pacificum TaxID=580166 RepID=A0A154WFU7_9PROT|nr:type VI secretion system baseplate subunit TssF [Oceanibaculum pacificum]KZD12369.1 hypothetical protein AUP43_16655 [Oceanibaculum pacificum]